MLGWLRQIVTPIQCGAFVPSTRKQCQHRGWYGGYCWSHAPKKSIFLPSLIIGVIGFIISPGVDWIKAKLYESAEVRTTHRTGVKILRHQDVLAELSSELRYLNVILKLREDASVKLQTGHRLLVSLSEDYGSRSMRAIEVLVEVLHLGSGPNEARLGVFFSTRVRVQDSTDYVRSISFNGIAWHWPIIELPVPLAVGANDPSPFRLVRDLNDFHVQVWLPAELAPSIDGIEIVANSSKGMERRLRLFSRNVERQNWADVDYDVKGRFYGKGNVVRERMSYIRDAKVDVGWSIAVRDAVWEENPVPPSWEGFRFQYRRHSK